MSYESPEARMSVAHALYNASCAGECTRIFAALPKIQRDRWGKLADYLHEIVSEKAALRQRCEELEKAVEDAYCEGWFEGNREGESAGQSLGFRMGRATASGDWEFSEARKALRGTT